MNFSKVLACCLCCLLSSTVFAGPEDAYNRTVDGQKIAWMDKGMEAVRAKLKDPRSADFRNVFFHRGSQNVPVTCGEVNSKNSFGGYIGFQRFVSAGQADLTYLEEQVADFPELWRLLCE